MRAPSNASESALWNTSVEHDPLGSSPTYVNGGSFGMTTSGPSGLDAVTGSFAYHGGMITTLVSGANCANQRYRITGTLEDVSTTTTANGSGSFDVKLTHYRARLFGRCVIYKARVAGSVSFTY